MIFSMQLADVGAMTHRGLRGGPDPRRIPGLRHAILMITAPLGPGVPKVALRRAGLLAAWDDDAAFESFLAADPLAERFADGWQTRLQPLRASGDWPAFGDLGVPGPGADDDEPVAVLTLGRLRLGQLPRFLRANSRSSGAAVVHPGFLIGTGLSRPPRVVSTFSLWRSRAQMADYAYGHAPPAHRDALAAHGAKPFHSASTFIRFRPYAHRGQWDGSDPLAELERERQTSSTSGTAVDAVIGA
jgi:hypothetical protein